MRTFEQYIREAVDFRLGGKARNGMQEQDYKYSPKDRNELKELMKRLRKERGEEANFNDIDTSEVTSMSDMFEYQTTFNGDISMWDTSKVNDMRFMFHAAESFNKAIYWDVGGVIDMSCMFTKAKNFNQDISNWNVSRVTYMNYMFNHAESFNRDISKWDVSKVTSIHKIFDACPIKEEYKPKFK